jgi:tRNA (guanine37-N1)-methyltransferase
MRFHIISIFPKILDSYFSESIIKRAQEKKIIKIKNYDLRQWTKDKHRTVDDTPYGGGAGMLMKIEPLYLALEQIKKTIKKPSKKKIVLLSAAGKNWNQNLAKKFSKLDDIIFICGRYEGVDARIKHFIDEEISIGNYVLTGGELATAVMVDSITRLLPGVLGNQDSLIEESHEEDSVTEYPQYTRPAIFKAKAKEYKVPKILQSGNHAQIKDWRNSKKKKIKTSK